ncbi:hypothetical protein D3C76_1258450 [compost metagenome]
MRSGAKSGTDSSPALAGIVFDDFHSFRGTSDRLQFSPRGMLTNKLHALCHCNRMRKDFYHLGEILVAVCICEFPWVTDKILYRWKNPFRLHWQIHFIDEPIDVKTN